MHRKKIYNNISDKKKTRYYHTTIYLIVTSETRQTCSVINNWPLVSITKRIFCTDIELITDRISNVIIYVVIQTVSLVSTTDIYYRYRRYLSDYRCNFKPCVWSYFWFSLIMVKTRRKNGNIFAVMCYFRFCFFNLNSVENNCVMLKFVYFYYPFLDVIKCSKQSGIFELYNAGFFFNLHIVLWFNFVGVWTMLGNFTQCSS